MSRRNGPWRGLQGFPGLPTRICTKSMRFPQFSAPVSVVIPARNAEAFLGEALASVREQRPPVLEIIVVDDGSTDESARVAVACGARLVRLRRSGPSAARNVGIRIARGTWVAFLDADDVWARGKIARQVEAAALLPEAGMIVCDRATISRGRVVDPHTWDRSVTPIGYLPRAACAGAAVSSLPAQTPSSTPGSSRCHRR